MDKKIVKEIDSVCERERERERERDYAYTAFYIDL